MRVDNVSFLVRMGNLFPTGAISWGVVFGVAMLFLLSAAGCSVKSDLSVGAVGAERISNADAEPGNWMTHGRDYGEQRFSPLAMIKESNVSELGLAWYFDTGSKRGHEATPLVVDGKMYLTAPWTVVHALDAATGKALWSFDPEVPREWARNACCDVVSRGLAMWEGKLFVATLDGRLIALEADVGEKVWEVNTIDRTKSYTITGAPRVVKGKVIIGNGGAEYGVRGYVTAYDAETGKLVWRFYTVPGNPAEPFEHPELEMASSTWTGTWWEYGGGGTAWDSMAYDPELDLLYVGTGNGSPWSRKIRSPEGGDNLFLASILAIKPDTGRLEWYYQTTPAETWDYTATQHIILADLEIGGILRKTLLQAPKNGFFYVLDRENGELISAEKYADVNWATHVDLETGRPVETEWAGFEEAPQFIKPSPDGAHTWHPMSFSPDTGLVYVPVRDSGLVYAQDEDYEYVSGRWNVGLDWSRVDEGMINTAPPPPKGYLKAWDPVKQSLAWMVEHSDSFNGGVLSTHGNLVFQGTADGRFVAYSADQGEKLWESDIRVSIVAPPITYTVDGVQYVSVVAGWGGSVIIGHDSRVSPAYEYENEGRVLTFKLRGNSPVPEPARRERPVTPVKPVEASAESVQRGGRLFGEYCSYCHGVGAVAGAITPDLRFSSQDVHDSFEGIVLGGALSHNGMAGFSDLLQPQDAQDIQAYVMHRRQESQ